LDILLQEDKNARNVFYEAGPELCFMTLADKPFNHYKKTEKGLKNRLNLIMDYCNCDSSFYESALKRFARKTVAKDDILDAWVLAICASFGKKNLRFLPENYKYDSTGLPMRIAIPLINQHHL
jgi:predicted RNase H-like nuclease